MFRRKCSIKGVLVAVPVLMILFVAGCATAPKKAPTETNKDVVKALGSVAEGLTNAPVSEKELKNLALQLEKDPKAQSAVRSVNEALSVQQKGVKYCPKDGRRFSSRVDKCPYDGTTLLPVE